MSEGRTESKAKRTKPPVNAACVRCHFDGMEVGVSEGPHAGERLFALVMVRGPRIHHRMGGLAVEDVMSEDGLR
jgi:hypothetical protein